MMYPMTRNGSTVCDSETSGHPRPVSRPKQVLRLRIDELRGLEALAAVVFRHFAIVAIANIETGLHGDPRTTNLNPGTPPSPRFSGWRTGRSSQA